MSDTVPDQQALQQRLEQAAKRLQQGYHQIGASKQHPYLYLVYDPSCERLVQALLPQIFQDNPPFTFHRLDLLSIAIESVRGQEERRQALLNDPRCRDQQVQSILSVWAWETQRQMEATLDQAGAETRPVLILSETAALHPIGTPSSFFAALDELHLPVHPQTGASIPLLILIPGCYPPNTYRSYQFLNQGLPISFYYGEFL